MSHPNILPSLSSQHPTVLSTLLLNGCPMCPSSRLSLTWSSSCSPCPGVLVLGVCPLIILSGAPGYCHKSKCHKKEPSPTVYNVKDENTLARHLQWNSTLCSQTSLLVQWLRVCLLKQGTWVWSLVQEDCTSRGATKPMLHSKRSHCNEKAHATTREWSLLTENRESLFAAVKTWWSK